MALAFGSSLASKVYLGATEINLAYFGATQVYSSATFSAEAQDYFDRLDAAGDTTYVGYKQPLANYIDGLVTLGGAYWDTMLSSTSFVGVGIQGITVPLRDGMTVPTQNNFVAADLKQLTGLKGNLSSKWIDTNISGQTPDQDDNSISTYATEVNTYNRYYLATGAALGATHIYPVSSTNLTCRISGGGSGVNATPLHFAGATRSAASVMNIRANGTDFPNTTTSVQQLTSNFNVFGRPNANRIDSRLATYHIGPALNLATLEGLQDTLITEIDAVSAAAEIAAFAAESGATDLTGLTNLVVYLKQENLYDNFVIYPMKSAQNAGSGSTVYSLGGLTTVDLTIVAGAPWTSAGIDLNGTNQWMTSTVSGSNAWTELSFGARVIPDDASVTNSPTQAYVGQGTNDTPRFTYLGNGTGSLSGERLVIGMQNAGVANRKGNTTFTWTAAEDFVFSGNMKTVTMSANGTIIPNNLTLGTATDYTPSQSGGTSNLIYHGALHFTTGGAVIPFKGVMAASYLCNASITDTQRHAIDGYLAAL